MPQGLKWIPFFGKRVKKEGVECWELRNGDLQSSILIFEIAIDRDRVRGSS